MTVPVSNMTAQFANTDYRYDAIGMDANTNGQADGSTLINLKANGDSKFTVDIYGNANTSGVFTANTIVANTINVVGSIIIGSPDSDISAANSAFIDNTIYSNNVRSNTINAGTLNVASIVINNEDLASSLSGYHTIWIPGSMMVDYGSTPINQFTVSGGYGHITCDFPGSSSEWAVASFQMPKSWDRGNVFIRFAISRSTTSGTGCVVGADMTSYGDSDPLGSESTDIKYVYKSLTTTDDIYFTNEIEVKPSPTPASSEELISIEVNRATANGSDNMTADMRLHGMAIRYNTDTATDD